MHLLAMYACTEIPASCWGHGQQRASYWRRSDPDSQTQVKPDLGLNAQPRPFGDGGSTNLGFLITLLLRRTAHAVVQNLRQGDDCNEPTAAAQTGHQVVHYQGHRPYHC
jgi:hypothetical protein